MTAVSSSRRCILFLQGPPSPFWYELANAFEAAGAETRRINFCSADWLFWRRKGAHNYRGMLRNWPEFLRRYIQKERVTDILYFSDRFPYHAAAAEVARECGVTPVAVEFGYLRPGWLTLEEGGMGAWSHFPDDPVKIREVSQSVIETEGPQPGEGFPAHKTSTELTFEIAFNIVNEYWRVFYPFYRRDKALSPTLEYLAGWLHVTRRRRDAEETASRLEPFHRGEIPFNLIALQLQTDYQIRENTTYRDQKLFLREVIAAFARAAPAERHLLIKLHPLDPGLINWEKLSRSIAEDFGVSTRVHCVDGGRLDELLTRCAGVIVSNSTVGLTALRAGVPVLALGDAVYGVAGLTHQGGLDDFWTAPDPVNASLLKDFVTALAGTIQVRGSVYDPEGREAAVREIVRRIIDRRVNGHGARIVPPPRLTHRRQPFQV